MRRFAVIGYPIGHTMSPFIHKRLFELSGMPADYDVIEISPGELESRIPTLKVLDGFNITIPHKTGIIPFLNSIDGTARLYGSVNTVRCNGEFKGYSTDGTGFLKALESGDVPLSGRIVIMGCGGVVRTIAFEAAKRGCDICFAVRDADLSACEVLKNEIFSFKPDSDIGITSLDGIKGEIDLLINGTPVGMYPSINAMPMPGEALVNTKRIFDAVYNPEDTLFIKTAREMGVKTVGGMPMLVWQAAAAHEIWDGVSYNVEDINAIIREANKYMNESFGGI